MPRPEYVLYTDRGCVHCTVGGRALSRVLYDKIYAKPNNKQNGCFLWHEDSVCICVCVCVYVCVCVCVSEMLNYKNNKTFN